jgi:aspartate/glutamate racemase
MQPTLVLVHTVPPLVSVFQALVAELLPGVRLFHILDEPMVERVKRRGGLADEDGERLVQHVEAAAAIGADVVLVTCSTISPVVDMIHSSAAIRVLKIDEAMIREAVSLGRRVGVVATAATTLEPTRDLLVAEAARQGKEVTPELVLVEGAIAALFAGNGESHDRLVAEAAAKFKERNGSVYCRELIGHDLMDPVERAKVVELGLFKTTCRKCILDAVEILEEIL